jgi:hypothetical protein
VRVREREGGREGCIGREREGKKDAEGDRGREGEKIRQYPTSGSKEQIEKKQKTIKSRPAA